MSISCQSTELLYSPSKPVLTRIYRSTEHFADAPFILYLHGGAFGGDPSKIEDQRVATALAEAGSIVFACEYVGSVGNRFPHAIDAALFTLRHIALRRHRFGSRSSMIFIAGEESGGNIAASVALRARDQIPDILSGQILLSPLLDPLMSTFSMRRAAEVGMREKWASGWSRYLAESGSVYHPYATPAYCSRLSGAPPSLFVSSTDDPLRDEGNQYAGRLSAAGVMVVKNVLATRSGWPTVYGGKTRRSPRWTAELRESVRAFLESLSTASQPNHDAVSA